MEEGWIPSHPRQGVAFYHRYYRDGQCLLPLIAFAESKRLTQPVWSWP